VDKGPWKAMQGNDSRWNVYSDDFTHDVSLMVNGDFGNVEDRKRYCEWLAARLNGESRALETACEHPVIGVTGDKHQCASCGVEVEPPAGFQG
jgi:hypothetical protein